MVQKKFNKITDKVSLDEMELPLLFFMVDPKEQLTTFIMTQALNGNNYLKDIDFINLIYSEIK